MFTKKHIQHLTRSNFRQLSRSSGGMVVSGTLTANGFAYMAAPFAVSARGFYKACKATKHLKAIAKARGQRLRKRDIITGVAEGTAEKAAVSFLTIGHSELEYAGDKGLVSDTIVQMHEDLLKAGGPQTLQETAPGVTEFVQGLGPVGEGNAGYNHLTDDSKADFDIKNGTPLDTLQHVQGHAVTGALAAGIEYGTNRVGYAGRVGRARVEMSDVYKSEEGKSTAKKLDL